jgi:hypothetical protein
VSRDSRFTDRLIDRMFGPRALSLRLISLIRPMRVVGLSKVRIGNAGGDGGYVMVDAFDGVAGALSIGIGGDVSWDLEIANRGIDVFQYDHTVGGPPVSHPRFRFTRAGIAASTSADGSFRSLDRMVADVPGGGGVLAKIDVEGAEWPALSSVGGKTMRRLAQFTVELHEPLPARISARLRNLRTLERIGRTHAVVHVHANNYAGVDTLDGIRVPSVVEVTYLRKRGLRFAPCDETFPTAVDRPNNPDGAEIPMSGILLQRDDA